MNERTLLFDAHVHIYPCHDVTRLFRTALDRFHADQADATTACLFLSEKSPSTFFRSAMQNPQPVPGGPLTLAPHASGTCLTLQAEGQPALLILPGRQISTSERLEISALFTDADIPDNRSMAESLALIRAVGGLPVINWALGKWTGAREKQVTQIMEQASAGELLVGDTSLRPCGFPEPTPFRIARQKGIHVLCGSDPLPFRGDENQVAGYGNRLVTNFDSSQPLASLKTILQQPALPLQIIGRRNGLLSACWRQLRLRF